MQYREYFNEESINYSSNEKTPIKTKKKYNNIKDRLRSYSKERSSKQDLENRTHPSSLSRSKSLDILSFQKQSVHITDQIAIQTRKLSICRTTSNLVKHHSDIWRQTEYNQKDDWRRNTSFINVTNSLKTEH